MGYMNKMRIEHKRKIEIEVEAGAVVDEYRIKLIRQTHFAREFGFNGDRYYISSNGIILNSNCPRFTAHPRIWTLAFPTNIDEFLSRQNIYLDIYPKSTFFVNGIIDAVEEYNNIEK